MQRDDRKLKQGWKLQQRETARAAFPLPDDDLAALLENIEDELAAEGCDHSLRATRKWLAKRGHDAEKVVAWLEENGGFCDCEVAANARDHWEQNRQSSSSPFGQIDVAELESRLDGTLPLAYRELVRSEASVLEKRGFDPKTLLVLNLELRSWDHVDAKGRLFLNSDDWGNHYFIELEAAGDRVLLWHHESSEIEDVNRGLLPYVREAEQLSRIDWPVGPGILYVCRTPTYGESILDPIGLEEWIAAVGEVDGIAYVGYREGRHPFTGETIRIDSPGLARLTEGEQADVSFHYGRAEIMDSPEHRSVALQLAKRLHAHVLSAG